MRLVAKGDKMEDAVKVEDSSNQEPQDKKMVPATELEHVMNDMHKYKRQANDAIERQKEYEEKLREIETNQQKSQGKYKELYENTNTELESYKSKYEGVLKSVIDDKKLTKVRELALQKNIRKEALDDLDMVDMSSVVVETTDQGRYNVLGADSFVDKLQQAKPHWFNDDKAPGVNNSTGSFDNTEKKFTPAELLEIQKKDPGLYREIITSKKHLIRR